MKNLELISQSLNLSHSGKPKAHPESILRFEDSGQARMTIYEIGPNTFQLNFFINSFVFPQPGISSSVSTQLINSF